MAAARDPVGVKGPKPSSSLFLCTTKSQLGAVLLFTGHSGHLCQHMKELFRGAEHTVSQKVPFTRKVSHVLIEKRCFTFSVWHRKG